MGKYHRAPKCDDLMKGNPKRTELSHLPRENFVKMEYSFIYGINEIKKVYHFDICSLNEITYFQCCRHIQFRDLHILSEKGPFLLFTKYD